MLPGEPHEARSSMAGTPERVCTTCNTGMQHLGDLREAGAKPAKRVFLCRGCNSIISELQ